MILRNRNGIEVPRSLLTLECNNNLKEIISDIISGIPSRIKTGKEKISDEYYRGNIISVDGKLIQDVVVALKGIYGNKCAFCESKRYAPDVEHFRPKKAVVGIKRSNHFGYYWLCYEWTNLIPSCNDCNSAKKNNFPILFEEKRVYGPIYKLDRALNTNANKYSNSPLRDERPILFHPEYDTHIETSFKFDDKGKIIGIDEEGRGEKTREICDLNRQDLLYFRKKEIDTFLLQFEIAIFNNNEGAFLDFLANLRTRTLDLDSEYTLMCKYIYNHFDEIIVPMLPFPVQHIASEIYEKHIEYYS